MTAKRKAIAILSKELENQKTIFQEHMGRAINPDGSEAYWLAKTQFDAADKKIKELEKEIARIITGGTPPSPQEIEEKFPYIKKKSAPPAGTQNQPSQSKVKLGG